MVYVDVALARVFTGGKFYSYSSNVLLKKGQIIKVPYGKKSAYGIVMSIVKKPTFKTKPIIQELPFAVPEESTQLLQWMIDYYPDDTGIITQLFIPANFSKSSKDIVNPSELGLGKDLPIANIEQKQALKTILNSKNKRILLRGDTGSGKTRVFIEKIQSVIKSGQSVLVLTPEIGLTPQLHDDLIKYVDAPILLTHSDLSDTRRRKIWQYAIASNNPSVFVGPRSALFLPINNLGLIVIDEAHDKSYKQGQSPRYYGLHIAGKLASLHNASLLQSTATPNVDDYEIAVAHKFKVITMTEQAAGSKPNIIKLIDLSEREGFHKSPYLSDELVDSITEALKNNQQVMLFLNRRGSARLIQCSNCGWQAKCQKCGIPMIYHHDNHHIKCHWCNSSQKTPYNCPECGSVDLTFKVIGTKSLVEHVSLLFPGARIKRFDADSSTKDKYHLNIQSIKNHEVDIVIGTQLISKGLDLAELGVVGVINADTGMNLPDYKAEESTFQQLYQVSGRAGRGRILSKTFIQTRLIDHPVMISVSNHSWQSFYDYEMPKRKKYLYPPFCYLALFTTRNKSSTKAEQKCQKAIDNLSKMPGLQILGPSPSYYEKSNDNYHWQFIVKAKNRDILLCAARKIPADFSLDINPTSLL